MIKNIIFDMGGVILPMQAIEKPIRRFAKLGLSEEKSKQMFGLYGQQGIFYDVEAGTITAEQFLREYSHLTGYSATFEEIEWAWRGFVSDPPQERLRWLEALRSEGFKVILLSNTNPFLMRFCFSSEFTPEGHPMDYFFDRIFCSYQMGGCKPDPKVFRDMLSQGGYKAEECLFLDDAMHNVVAAREQGIHSIHVPDNQPWIDLLRGYFREHTE